MMGKYAEMSCFGYNGPESDCNLPLKIAAKFSTQESSSINDEDRFPDYGDFCKKHESNVDTMSKPVEYFPVSVETVFTQTEIPEKTLSVSDLLAYIRGLGWRVHAHYDSYNAESHCKFLTCWTFTKNNEMKSCMDVSDLEALTRIRNMLIEDCKSK